MSSVTHSCPRGHDVRAALIQGGLCAESLQPHLPHRQRAAGLSEVSVVDACALQLEITDRRVAQLHCPCHPGLNHRKLERNTEAQQS